MSCSELEQKEFSPPKIDFSPYGEKDLKTCPEKKTETNNHKVLSHPSPPLTLSKRRERCNKKVYQKEMYRNMNEKHKTFKIIEQSFKNTIHKMNKIKQDKIHNDTYNNLK